MGSWESTHSPGNVCRSSNSILPGGMSLCNVATCPRWTVAQVVISVWRFTSADSSVMTYAPNGAEVRPMIVRTRQRASASGTGASARTSAGARSSACPHTRLMKRMVPSIAMWVYSRRPRHDSTTTSPSSGTYGLRPHPRGLEATVAHCHPASLRQCCRRGRTS